jgi:hypothetical protein
VEDIMRSKLLIPVNNRSQFIILFTLFTTILWEFRFEIARPISHKLTGTFLEDGLIWGLSMGTAQGIILRPYISSKSWILATTLGWAITMSLSGFSLVTFLLAPLVLGVAQWFVVRRYTNYSWLWILIPAISVAPVSIVNEFHLASLGNTILTGIIVGLVPAVSLCLLPKKDRQNQDLDEL